MIYGKPFYTTDLLHSRAAWVFQQSEPLWRRRSYHPGPTWPDWEDLWAKKGDNPFFRHWPQTTTLCENFSESANTLRGSKGNYYIYKQNTKTEKERCKCPVITDPWKRCHACAGALVTWGSQMHGPSPPRLPVRERHRHTSELTSSITIFTLNTGDTLGLMTTSQTVPVQVFVWQCPKWALRWRSCCYLSHRAQARSGQPSWCTL